MSAGLRLLLDQMIDADVAEQLRTQGYSAVRVADVGLARADDGQVLEYARKEALVLVTLDEDFGDWAVLPLRCHPGVIRLKVDPATSTTISRLLLGFLAQHAKDEFRDVLVIAGTRGARWVHTA